MQKTVQFAIVTIALAGSALAQPQLPQGAVVVTSEPGKVAAVTVTTATATVVAIDAAARVVTLKAAQGRLLEVYCGSDVKNFAQIRVGDRVKATYREALTLELRKTGETPPASATAGFVGAAPGSTPAGAVSRQIRALVDVVAVDPGKSTITLKDATGNVIELKVRNPEQFKVVKKGDQVEVTYTRALAVTVTPVADAKETVGKGDAGK